MTLEGKYEVGEKVNVLNMADSDGIIDGASIQYRVRFNDGASCCRTGDHLKRGWVSEALQVGDKVYIHEGNCPFEWNLVCIDGDAAMIKRLDESGKAQYRLVGLDTLRRYEKSENTQNCTD